MESADEAPAERSVRLAFRAPPCGGLRCAISRNFVLGRVFIEQFRQMLQNQRQMLQSEAVGSDGEQVMSQSEVVRSDFAQLMLRSELVRLKTEEPILPSER
jgi:hypothetical protein